MASTHEGGFTLLGDQPWKVSPQPDPLGFSDQAERLARVIVDSRRRSPFTLAIEGAWGSGKSSFMRCLEGALKSHARVRTVRFNAWSAERGDVAEGLVKSVLQEVAPLMLTVAAVQAGALRSVRAIALLLASRLGLASIVDAVWAKAKNDDAARNRLAEMLQCALRRSFAKGGLVVVFVDDLDRVTPGAALRAFEAIKTYLDARGLVFVVALDAEIISEALLAEKHYGPNVTPERYLEKIIQIAHRVSVPDDLQVDALMDAYARDCGLSDRLDPDLRAVVVAESARNPRKMKNFINAAVLSLRLDDPEGRNAEAHLRVSALKFYFPELARLVVDDPNALEEFLTYVSLRRGDVVVSDPEVRPFLRDHGLLDGDGASSTSDVTLADVERTLPESFPTLAANDRLVTIAEDLRRARSLDLGAELQKVVIPEHAAQEAGITETSLRFDRLRVLWIDDNPSDNESLVKRIERGGGAVIQVDSAPAAEQAMASSPMPFDVLISDIARGGDSEAGFSDLKRWQTDGTWMAPTVFFAARITPERRARARELHAAVTSAPQELMQQLAAIAVRMRAGPGGGLA